VPSGRRDLKQYAGSAARIGQFGLSEVCDSEPAIRGTLAGQPPLFSFFAIYQPGTQSSTRNAGCPLADPPLAAERHGTEDPGPTSPEWGAPWIAGTLVNWEGGDIQIVTTTKGDRHEAPSLESGSEWAHRGSDQ
jgi:hypothetical protein